MTTPCIGCARFQMKGYPKHAELGYGRCMVHPVALFVHIERKATCPTHQAAEAKKVEARMVWWAQRQEKNKENMAEDRKA